jgi:hypothetical protein
MATISLSKQSNNKAKSGDIPDNTLITLITSIVNKDTKFKKVPKGVWLWNRTDNKFLCSASFRELMDISLLTIPDLDFWMEHLTIEDLGTLAETLTGVLLDSKPRNFICRITIPKVGKQIFRCFIEPLTNPVGKNYIIGIFCNITEIIFPENRN